MSDHHRTFDAFAADARASGFDEVLERVWAPGLEVPPHSHAFAVKALVVAGDFWLTVDGAPRRHLAEGDGFELAPGVVHAEAYGAGGATFWGWRAGTRSRSSTPPESARSGRRRDTSQRVAASASRRALTGQFGPSARAAATASASVITARA